jgi:hypothetical protein
MSEKVGYTRKLDERLHIRREIRKLITEGRSDDDIKAELCLSDHDWESYRTAFISQESSKAKRPDIEIFIEYQLRQLGHIDELEKARQVAVKKQQPQHAVSATKAKAELLDKIIQRGQDLGIYHREGQKLMVSGAMGLVHLTPHQLAERLDRSVMRLKALSDDLGHPLELSGVVDAVREERSLKIVDVAAEDAAEVPEEQAPDEPIGVPEEELSKPRFQTKVRSVSASLKHGDGDPGPDHPLAERVYKAAMEPRAGAGRPTGGEIAGDPAGLRGRVFGTCPKCPKRCLGVPGLQRHIRFIHQVDEATALDLARKAIDDERMSIARGYAATIEGDL